MAKLSPTDAAAKWSNRLSNSTQDIANGINAVTVAPGQKAAAKSAKMKANLNAAIDSGKWAQRVSGVTLQQWKDAAINKGVPRIAGGAQAAQPKMTAFLSQLFPYQDSLKSSLASMPDVTPTDNENRMLTWMRGMSKFKQK